MTDGPVASLPGDLGTAAALAERRFLAAGESLEQAITILDRLTQCFGSLVNRLTGAALAETHHELASASARVAALAEAQRADASALQTLAEIATASSSRIATLRPIAQEMETLSLCARVVAGGMGSEAADFAVFAGSIRNAAQHARTCLNDAAEALAQVHQDLQAARDDADRFVRGNGAAMQAIPTRLAGNLHSLALQQRAAATAVTAVHARSEQIRLQVAAEVVALQLGDITRQRIEHVQAAALLQPQPQRRVGCLLAAQLTDAADALLQEGNRIEAGLDQLAQAAQAIGDLGVQVHGEMHTGGFLVELEADVRQTAGLFGQLSSGAAETGRHMTAVLHAADVLASRLAGVQAAQEDIRIMGLNAALKCGRLGAIGRPLSAVAQELRLCSGRSGAHAASVLLDLDRLRRLAADLQDPARRVRHEQMAQAADALLAPLQRLGELEAEVAATLAQLQSDADEVCRLMAAAVEQFGVRHTLAADLRTAAAAFAAWTAADDAAATAALESLAAIYTMAREREVHARFAPLPQVAAPSVDFADVLF